MNLFSFLAAPLVAAAVLGFAGSARADAGGPVIVVVHSDSPLVNDEAVRQTIVEELGPRVKSEYALSPEDRATARGTLVVTYHGRERQLAVTWQDAAHGSVTRVVDAPSRPSAILRTTALLAGELARNDLGLPASPAAPTGSAKGSASEAVAPPPGAPPTPSTSPSPLPLPSAPLPKEPAHTWINLSFVYPLATNAGHPDVRTHLDFGLPSSRIGTLSGFGLGVVEVADEVRGMQLGLVNVAGHLHGVQLGAVNVDGDVDGLPLGLVSVSRDGGIHPLAWFDTLTEVNAGAKFATRSTYTVLAAAGHFDERARFRRS